MPDTALYFPYIEPPDDAWFRQMVLYWDSVGAIVPYGYEFDRHVPTHVSRLLTTGLLRQVHPIESTYRVDGFGQDFVAHIESRQQAERVRPRWSKHLKGRTRIHVQKLAWLGEHLQEMGLAKRLDHEWFDVDAWVAGDFMAYLACTLGQLDRNRFQPITNDPYCEAVIAGGFASFSLAGSAEKARVRDTLLVSLLPSPPTTASFEEIADFKERHHKLIKPFRDLVEKKCIMVAAISNPADRADVARAEARELDREAEELKRRMEESWRNVVFATLLPLVAAGAQMTGATSADTAGWISSVAGLGAAGYATATALKQRDDASHPLAYSARFRRELSA